MRKTKIVCTLGPATDNEDVLRKLMLAGMNVARLNFSHGTHEEQKKRMDMVKKLRAELGLPIAILLDTKGPEIRTRDFEGGKAELKAGDFFTLTTRDLVGDSTITSITYKDLYKDVQIGTHILIDDGLIELQVTSISGEDILCTVITGGPVSNHKGINVPDVHLNMPYLSEVDQSDILFGIEQDVDFIAASFVRSAKDVLEIRELLNANGGNNINIISKIENSEGVNHIDDIIYVSDGIMVARGDMGVEIPCEEVPVIQKMIINKVYMAGKQVITATQMLDSMIKNPRPTRAETTDVANAIYDGTSAVMLSGESAAGKYPVDAVRNMAEIAEYTESQIKYTKRFRASDFEFHLPRPSYMIHTLDALQSAYPEREFTLIIGADNWAIFPRWYHSDEIIQRHRIMIYPRPGYTIDPAALPPSVQQVDTPLLEISSTFIRRALAEGKDVRYFLHPAVNERLTR